MIGKLGDLYKMQKEARNMQNEMKKIQISGFSNNEDVEIVMDGTQEIIEIGIKDELLTPEKKDSLVKGIKQAVKDAQKKIQKEMMKNMDLDKLKGMLGS